MADDALKQALIEVDFKAGEMPTPAKLTGSVEQLRLAVAEIDRAIGDLYNQQGHVPSLSQIAPTGPSLTRIVGGSGRLNPRQIGRIRVSNRNVIFAAGVAEVGSPGFSGFTHYNRREFQLPYPPIQITSSEGAASFTFQTSVAAGDFTVTTPGGYTDATVGGAPGGGPVIDPSSRVASLSALNATGEWHVSDDGVITTFDPLPSGYAFKVIYTFDSIPSNYDGCYFNVIPDFAQTATLCTVALVSGTTYTVSLPALSQMRGEDLTDRRPWAVHRWWTDSSARSSPMKGTLLELPYNLSTMIVGQTIPAGYILLWDDTAREVVEGITFKYASQTSVTAEGVPLTVGTTRYRLVVGGTNLTGTVDRLADSYQHHNHSGQIQTGTGLYMGQRVHHYDLTNLIDEGTNSREGFTVSSIGPTRNPHPQSLHRYGYQFGESISDPGNVDNAMLGSLVMSNTSREIGTAADSYSIYFASLVGPQLRYDQGNNRFEILNKNTYIQNALEVDGNTDLDGTLDVEDGIQSGVGAAGVDFIKWTRQAVTLPGAGNSVTESFTDPGDIASGVLAVKLSINDTGTSYLSDRSSDESATRYLWVSQVQVSDPNIEVGIQYGDNLRGKSGYALIFYY